MNHDGTAVNPGEQSSLVQLFQPFKMQPFYCVMANLVSPTRLGTPTYRVRQSKRIDFMLEKQHVNDIESSLMQNAGSIPEFMVQVHLRFCMVEESSEHGDRYPPDLTLHVNGQFISLPNPIHLNVRDGMSREVSLPINIVSSCFLSHLVVNTVYIEWRPVFRREYAVGVFLVRKVSVAMLLGVLQHRIRDTRETAKQKVNLRATSGDIAETRYVSLLCPLSKTRMNLPCRGLWCKHLECFDAVNYLQSNEQRPVWVCPVCGERASYASLVIDQLFVDILNKVPGDLVVLHEDWTWSSSEEQQECDSGAAASATPSLSSTRSSTRASLGSSSIEQVGSPSKRPT